MAPIPTEVLPRLQAWWLSVEPGMQALLEAIYMEAPAAVSRAVSAGAWVADDAEPGLSAQLGSDSFDLTDQIPTVTSAAPDIAPFHPGVGQAVTITWTETNTSRATMPAYATDVYVYDPDQNVVGSGRLDGAELPAGAAVARTWQFPGAATAGQHRLVVYLNSEGNDPGSGAPGPQGYRSATGSMFEVGGGDSAAMMQNETAWSTALGAFGQVSEERPHDSITALTEGLNWAASIDVLRPEIVDRLAASGHSVSIADTERLGEKANLATEAATIRGIAMSGVHYNDPGAVGRLLDAIDAYVTP